MDCGDCRVKDGQILRMRARINELEMKEMERNRADIKRNAAFRKQGRLVNQKGWQILGLERDLENKVARLEKKLEKKRRHADEDWKENDFLKRKIRKMKEKKRAARREARRACRRTARLEWEKTNNELVREGLKAMLMEEARMERLEQQKEIYRRELKLARCATKAIKTFRKIGLVEHKELLLVLSSMNEILEKMTRPVEILVPRVSRPAEHVEE